MDQEVAKTLGELERKLRELERELTTIGRRESMEGEPYGQAPREPPDRPAGEPFGLLVDEAVEQQPALAREQPFAQREAVEQRFSMESRETVYGEIPATRDKHEAIDLAELVRFKERMQRTLGELIDEYSRLLSLEPPSRD